ncbi:SulP family inorganic anion transporter [Brevibacillus nitrificans]|uniref:SulP family inorganic anion transporter n=1 Tax=Brevibacillus nitrificans TaxID=651560 RepID=UPI00260EFE97|nr:SulP family inorganic anion transporter [Brevibacillus nitrificans]MED1791284.1 SulP family inorganic anion transporter [Brevibacillus nitrificans]
MKWTGRFEGYSMQSFRKDCVSGFIVAVIALPLGMAFAIASGVKPEYGIYTTIVAGILISLFGGSRFQIGGPTGAFIPILFAIVMQYGYENLLIAGLMAGILLVIMGVLRLGALIQYIPRPVTVGFTAGIAVIIFSGQIVHFLGLRDIQKHEDFLSNMKEIVLHLSTLNIYSITTACICFALILLTPRIFPKVPGSLIGLVISTLVAVLLFEENVATIGSTFGAFPGTLPSFHFPEITLERIQTLLNPALVIALLGAVESLLSAVVADGMSNQRHNSNRELIGQGIANIITPLFGGIPATGAIARTATNIRSGAASPLSGVIHGFIVLLILVLFAPYASHIPLASMAPILMLVAWNMSERREFLRILKTKTSDSIVLLITFLLTVFTDLTLAVEVGLVLAILLFVKRMSGSLIIAKALPDPDSKHQKVMPHMVSAVHDCPQISIFTVEGPLFFGDASLLEKSILSKAASSSGILLLRMGGVPFLDTTGEASLASIVRHFHSQGKTVLFSGLRDQPKALLKRTGLYERIGAKNDFAHTGEAIDSALTRLNHAKCLGCQHFVFRECSALSDQGNIRQTAAAQNRELPADS